MFVRLIADTVEAIQLQALLTIAQYVYASTEWLTRAEEQPPGVYMEDYEYVPPPTERLFIEHLEIGTPNKLTFKGRLQGIAAVAAVLTALLNVPNAGTTAYKTFAEGQKTQAEAFKILEETELLKLQRRQLEKLESEGRISEQSRREKEQAPLILAHYFSQAAPLLVEQVLQPKGP